MSRYIDADKIDWRLIIPTNVTTAEENMIHWAKNLIERQPTADVREVIPCEDCKHSSYFVDAHTDNYGTSVKAKVYCRIWQDWVPPEGYCFLADMRGEREDGEIH